MRNDLVYRSNVVFEFYKAALNKEISPDDFRIARAIISRAKPFGSKSVEEKLAECFRKIGEDAREISAVMDAGSAKLHAMIEDFEQKED